MINEKVVFRGIFLGILVLLILKDSDGQERRSLDLTDAEYYGVGEWNGDSLGNHRVVLNVVEKTNAVWAHIPWRRRDEHSEEKNIIVVDAETGRRIGNVCRISINREFGDLVFQPESTPGEYYVYYMPYITSGRGNYPTVTYQRVEKTAEEAWLEKFFLTPDQLSGEKWRKLPRAEIVQFQSSDEFNSFYPMEVIATSAEVGALLEKHADESYLLFPEDRSNPIRMTRDIPHKWIEQTIRDSFRGRAGRGEFYAFQIGVYAVKSDIADIEIRFSELRSRDGKSKVPADAFTCFNTGGIDWAGNLMDKICPVEKGRVQALWMGVQIPERITPGEYRGEVNIVPVGIEEKSVTLFLDVSPHVLKDGGDGEPWRHSRLRWLNSRIAEDEGIVPPFTPLTVRKNRVGCLGREVILDKTGFPRQIQSLFSPEMTCLVKEGRELLSAPVRLVVENDDGKLLKWGESGFRITKQAEGAVAWEAETSAGCFTMHCLAQMEFDGNIEFLVTLTASESTRVGDIRLEIPMVKDVARYMMGMGFKGGTRPEGFHWKWDVKKNQDGVWVGDVNGGLQCSFRDLNYSRPLNTNFYHSKPLNMPPSWTNEGKGGFRLRESDQNTVLLTAYSGERVIHEGEKFHFNFRLLVTPFKLLDTRSHWHHRYYHRFEPVGKIEEAGANTINVHHATEINPFINYPFLRPREMKKYVDEAHERNMKVKIYYTVRELSNRAPELFALRSLGYEILSRGSGGGFSWLQEHLDPDYIAGWLVPRLRDAAVINSGVSRWHNYYLEGLNWLVQNVGIDGLYIDDVAFDRTVMKRVRKILDRGREGALIDLHSANQYNVRDGFANSANLYLEHFPYLNRLWFGEYFDYNASPDFWLIEMSGIPFGVMGEMLQDGGNPWRGMIYGMTSRLPWAGDPRSLWKVWDDFGIQESQMMGYWVPSCPVKTDHHDVLATAYVREGKTLVSVASWADEFVNVTLKMDWNGLGLDPANVRIDAPSIHNFQEKNTFTLEDPIPVQPARGWLLIISEQFGGFDDK